MHFSYMNPFDTRVALADGNAADREGQMDGGRAQDEATATVPLQPRPEHTWLAHFSFMTFHFTAVMRLWKSGDPERCRLCTRCRATGGGCLMIVPKHVERESAPLFSPEGFIVQGDVATVPHTLGVVGGHGQQAKKG